MDAVLSEEQLGGSIPGGNFLGGNFPEEIFRVGIFLGGIFQEPFQTWLFIILNCEIFKFLVFY